MAAIHFLLHLATNGRYGIFRDEFYAMPYETRRPVLVCRGLKLPLEDAWRRGKSYI